MMTKKKNANMTNMTMSVMKTVMPMPVMMAMITTMIMMVTMSVMMMTIMMVVMMMMIMMAIAAEYEGDDVIRWIVTRMSMMALRPWQTNDGG